MTAEDPVHARRARAARLAATGKRIGYGLFLLAIVVFVAGAIAGFSSGYVTVVVVALAVGSAVLAPSIIVGYGVKAAAREERGEPSGH